MWALRSDNGCSDGDTLIRRGEERTNSSLMFLNKKQSWSKPPESRQKTVYIGGDGTWAEKWQQDGRRKYKSWRINLLSCCVWVEMTHDGLSVRTQTSWVILTGGLINTMTVFVIQSCDLSLIVTVVWWKLHHFVCITCPYCLRPRLIFFSQVNVPSMICQKIKGMFVYV